jgi:hypothetical protein
MGIMNQNDKEIFEKHLPFYESYKKHSFIRNYSKDVYNELIHLYTTYVDKKHNFSHWCSSCRAELVVHLYNWYLANEPTTWYAEEEKKEVLADIPFTTEEVVIENLPPKKRTKKSK